MITVLNEVLVDTNAQWSILSKLLYVFENAITVKEWYSSVCVCEHIKENTYGVGIYWLDPVENKWNRQSIEKDDIQKLVNYFHDLYNLFPNDEKWKYVDVGLVNVYNPMKNPFWITYFDKNNRKISTNTIWDRIKNVFFPKKSFMKIVEKGDKLLNTVKGQNLQKAIAHTSRLKESVNKIYNKLVSENAGGFQSSAQIATYESPVTTPSKKKVIDKLKEEVEKDKKELTPIKALEQYDGAVPNYRPILNAADRVGYWYGSKETPTDAINPNKKDLMNSIINRQKLNNKLTDFNNNIKNYSTDIKQNQDMKTAMVSNDSIAEKTKNLDNRFKRTYMKYKDIIQKNT